MLTAFTTLARRRDGINAHIFSNTMKCEWTTIESFLMSMWSLTSHERKLKLLKNKSVVKCGDNLLIGSSFVAKNLSIYKINGLFNSAHIWDFFFSRSWKWKNFYSFSNISIKYSFTDRSIWNGFLSRSFLKFYLLIAGRLIGFRCVLNAFLIHIWILYSSAW